MRVRHAAALFAFRHHGNAQVLRCGFSDLQVEGKAVRLAVLKLHSAIQSPGVLAEHQDMGIRVGTCIRFRAARDLHPAVFEGDGIPTMQVCAGARLLRVGGFLPGAFGKVVGIQRLVLRFGFRLRLRFRFRLRGLLFFIAVNIFEVFVADVQHQHVVEAPEDFVIVRSIVPQIRVGIGLAAVGIEDDVLIFRRHKLHGDMCDAGQLVVAVFDYKAGIPVRCVAVREIERKRHGVLFRVGQDCGAARILVVALPQRNGEGTEDRLFRRGDVEGQFIRMAALELHRSHRSPEMRAEHEGMIQQRVDDAPFFFVLRLRDLRVPENRFEGAGSARRVQVVGIGEIQIQHQVRRDGEQKFVAVGQAHKDIRAVGNGGKKFFLQRKGALSARLVEGVIVILFVHIVGGADAHHVDGLFPEVRFFHDIDRVFVIEHDVVRVHRDRARRDDRNVEFDFAALRHQAENGGRIRFQILHDDGKHGERAAFVRILRAAQARAVHPERKIFRTLQVCLEGVVSAGKHVVRGRVFADRRRVFSASRISPLITGDEGEGPEGEHRRRDERKNDCSHSF